MTQSAAPGTSSAAEVPELATFGQRFMAVLADWLLCLLLANGLLAAEILPRLEYPVWPSVVVIVEYALFLTFFSQTPGMRLARIHCVRAESGEVLGAPRALGRAVLLALVLPIFTAFSDPYRRGLHDKAVGSAMVR